MKKALPPFLAALFVLSAAASAATLSVGDPAPELKVSKWVKGGPVESLDPAQTYVVEFWATWCGPCRSTIPHLTELARQFTNATFIGVSVWERGENPGEKVAKFVESMGDQMGYAVAMDADDGFMAKNWMEAAEQRGIPAAFVVREGKVAWIGHPMSMAHALETMTGKTFDDGKPPEPAPVQRPAAGTGRKAAELWGKYFDAASGRHHPEVAADLAQEIEELNIRNPDLLNEIAWFILTDERVRTRDLPFATRLAKRALDLTQEQRGDILDTYARALWDAGQKTEALAYQKKAAAAAPGDAEIAASLEKYLDETDPAGPALKLQTERYGALAAAVEDAIYVLGGSSDHGVVGSIERFAADSPTTEILPTALLPRRYHAGAAWNGRIYVVGGVTPRPDSEFGVALMDSSVLEEFDPAAGAVRQLAPLPRAVSRAGAAVVGDRLYVVGGAEAETGARSTAVQIYDFGKDAWSRGADLPLAREGHVFAHDGKIYAPGGFDGTTALRDFWVYDPAQDEWRELPKLPVKTSAHNGIAMNGKLYLFGDYEVLGRSAVYGFAKQKWSLIDLGYRPARHASVARLGDDVFVIGGNVQPTPPNLARTQRFSAKQLAQAPRREWTAENEAAGAGSGIAPPAAAAAGTNAMRLCRCGRHLVGGEPTPPDPRFFRLKWTRKLDDASAHYGSGSRVECWIPPRHLVLESKEKLYVHDANDGRLVHTIPLPPEARKTTEGIGDGTPDFVYLRDGDSGFAVGNQTLYEVTHKTANSSSYRSIGERWMGLRDDGELLWQREETNQSGGKIYALPVGENRDWLLAASWRGFQIMDARQNVMLDQNQGMGGGRWIFRLAPEGGGIEALVIGQDVSCYGFIPAGDGAAAPPGERPRAAEPARPEPAPPVEPTARSKIEAFSEILEKNPDDVLALHWRGFLYAMAGDAKRSRKDFESALRLAPEDKNVPWSYGWALLNLGDFAGAAKQWERWLELDKTIPPEADYHLALAYWGGGQKEKALEIFNAAVAREPGFWISREHARRYTALWTEKEKAIVYGLYDAWCRVYSPPANAADYPMPEPDPPASEPNPLDQE